MGASVSWTETGLPGRSAGTCTSFGASTGFGASTRFDNGAVSFCGAVSTLGRVTVSTCGADWFVTCVRVVVTSFLPSCVSSAGFSFSLSPQPCIPSATQKINFELTNNIQHLISKEPYDRNESVRAITNTTATLVAGFMVSILPPQALGMKTNVLNKMRKLSPKISLLKKPCQ
jgi:hypothetical protein